MGQPAPKPVVVGTAAELATYVPSKAELTHESDTGLFKVGDGVTAHASLAESAAAVDSASVVYDNDTSSLTATDVQAALDEVVARIVALETP